MRVAASILSLVLCAGSAFAAHTQEEAAEKAKAMVKELAGGLKTELEAAVKQHGFAGAVSACGEIALPRAEKISKANSARIRRVSLKNRNAANAPDELEARLLAAMEADMAQGALKEAYQEKFTAQDGKPAFRFLKPIVTTAFCLNCHGDKSALKPEVAAKLAEKYPNDKAVGYMENQLRGAFSVTIPLGE